MDNNQPNRNANQFIISQNQIVPGTIKPRHLAATTVASFGDTFYSDGTNFKRLSIGTTRQLLFVNNQFDSNNVFIGTAPSWDNIGNSDLSGLGGTAYTNYTFTSGGGAFTNAPTVNNGYYYPVGNRTFFMVDYTYNATSGGTGTTIITGLPTAAGIYPNESGSGIVVGTGKSVNVYYDSATNHFVVLLYDGTTAIANSAHIVFNIFIAAH